MPDSILLTGADLTPRGVAAVARGAGVRLAAEGLKRMRRCHLLLEAAIAEERPIYGVTTGLGPRVTERLSAEAQRRFSRDTIRGRAQSAGRPLDPALVRAAMCVRANTLLIGAAGARPALAELIAACLAAGLTPVVRETGSVGAADVVWGGSLGLGLIGEGEMVTPDGIRPAAEALRRAGLAPYVPGPREGLALVSNSAFTAAIAAVGLARALSAFDSAQTAAALCLEGFRANLSPLDRRTLMLRPQPGQVDAAAGLMLRLEGSALTRPGAARRLQDPLSLRCIAQVHGAASAALEAARQAVLPEINGASDSPAVLEGTGEIVSHGGFLTPHLGNALTALARSLAQLAATQAARIDTMLTARLTGLPGGLSPGDGAGLGPCAVTAAALAGEIAHLAQPAPFHPVPGADGVEDIATHSPVLAKVLHEIVDRLQRLVAIELMVGAQAIELRRPESVPHRLAAAMARLRRTVPRASGDRPLGDGIAALAARVAAGDFELPEDGR